jgi:hypothetical protein
MGRAFLILHASKAILVLGSFKPLDLSFMLREFLLNYSLLRLLTSVRVGNFARSIPLKGWLIMWLAAQTFRLV